MFRLQGSAWGPEDPYFHSEKERYQHSHTQIHTSGDSGNMALIVAIDMVPTGGQQFFPP